MLEHVVRLGRRLRVEGVNVGVGEEVDGASALMLVDLLDPDEVRRALRTAFRIQPRDRAAFDRAFAEVWTDHPTDRLSVRRVPRESRSDLSGAVLLGRPVDTGDVSAQPGSDAAGTRPGYSRELLLRRKPFQECAFEDLPAMSRLLERMARRLATRRSRRLVPTRGRGAVDARRSFRRAVGTGGEMVWLARRARALDVPRLVALCDTSGSMDAHVHFLLTFLIALKRQVPRTEIFAFNTSLVRVTRSLVPGRIRETLAHLAADVPDWSGGTKIGESLLEFVATHAANLVSDRTVVLIFSDGLDRGDTSLVGEAMRALHSRARKVVWLNPLGGDSRYEPTARAMQAALPFIDCLAPVNNLESIERLVSELTL